MTHKERIVLPSLFLLTLLVGCTVHRQADTTMDTPSVSTTGVAVTEAPTAETTLPPDTTVQTLPTTVATVPTEETAVSTQPEKTTPPATEPVQHTYQTATQPSEPPATVAVSTESTGAAATVPNETTPSYHPTTSPAEPTQLPKVTESVVTQPTETVPPVTELASTAPTETEPTAAVTAATVPPTTVPLYTELQETTQPATIAPIMETTVPEEIDTAELEKYGRSYAVDTYGYEGDPSLDITNAGAFPGVTVTINTMQEGYAAVERAVDRQYNHDMGMGYPVVMEIDGVLCRAKINLCFEPTDDPNTFILWCFYR